MQLTAPARVRGSRLHWVDSLHLLWQQGQLLGCALSFYFPQCILCTYIYVYTYIYVKLEFSFVSMACICLVVEMLVQVACPSGPSHVRCHETVVSGFGDSVDTWQHQHWKHRSNKLNLVFRVLTFLVLSQESNLRVLGDLRMLSTPTEIHGNPGPGAHQDPSSNPGCWKNLTCL